VPLEEVSLEIPVGRREPGAGTIRLGRRSSQVPYFSQDVILLESLAEVFAYLLENVRLQGRKQQQEQREKELSLHASRSELKALRAQINPHFLFNALNAIAGLIPKDPARADRAVEQLAEVFRYTLRRSESEWASLKEEMEAVKAYLDLEQARFGARLQYRVTLSPGVEEARIPALVVQTLVENAVKHGVATIRGPGRIDVDASLDSGWVEIRVADNGPGFPPGADMKVEGSGEPSGFGLRNIRERLQGHFGERASLGISHQEGRRGAVVSVRIPLQPAPRATAWEAQGLP
jgi:LytS/YehU family sensor histidine kinase